MEKVLWQAPSLDYHDVDHCEEHAYTVYRIPLGIFLDNQWLS